MTFSFSLVVGLFLLASGLAVFAGVYHGSHLNGVESPPPPPGSILTLAIVTIGALIAHLIAAGLFVAQDAVCVVPKRCFTVSFDPNVYSVLFNLGSAKPVSAVEGFLVLATLLVLSASSFELTRRLIELPKVGEQVAGVLYGWFAEVLVARNAQEVVLAYIVSDVQNDGTLVGYEGVIENMTTNADKQITSVLLKDCETFYLRVTDKGVARREAGRTRPIPQLYLDQTRIKNMAFERVNFE